MINSIDSNRDKQYIIHTEDNALATCFETKEWLSRMEALIGREKLSRLSNSAIAIAGLGGVGSFAAESIARAGISNIKLIDYDTVSISNLNRQIIALHDTIGRNKTDVMKERILNINPIAKVEVYSEFLSKSNRRDILLNCDFVIDAIDTIGPKMGVIKEMCDSNIDFISCLGAGNRLNPETITIMSIWDTEGCPMTKRLKKMLRKNGVERDFPVVFSTEVPVVSYDLNETLDKSDIGDSTHIPKSLIGSISYMPAIVGMMAASWVIRKIIEK